MHKYSLTAAKHRIAAILSSCKKKAGPVIAQCDYYYYNESSWEKLHFIDHSAVAHPCVASMERKHAKFLVSRVLHGCTQNCAID